MPIDDPEQLYRGRRASPPQFSGRPLVYELLQKLKTDPSLVRASQLLSGCWTPKHPAPRGSLLERLQPQGNRPNIRAFCKQLRLRGSYFSVEASMDHGVSLSLAGKVALITGGSRGIGAETVRLFCGAGARVVFSYRAARHEADLLAAACGGPDHCVAVQQELCDAEQGRTLVEQAISVFDRLDCLVVNHGVWPPADAPIDSMTDEQWSSTMGINLDSVFGLVQNAVAQMKRQAPEPGGVRGHIVLVSSTAGQRGEAFHADYSASKGALVALTKSLSSELAGEGIYANCVAPGWVATDMSAPALSEGASREKIFATIPLGRVGTPQEIAGPILFLCTPYAGFMSGEIVNVNGGAVLVG